MIRPDLHMHTTASDGIYDAAQLARLVQRADVTLFSITDHDTMAGLPQALNAAYDRGLAFIPGVEISTESEDEVHILGYGVKYDDPVLNECFSQAAQDRKDRILNTADKLAEMGLTIDKEALLSQAGASMGRPLLARALADKGYAKDVQEAFEKYLRKGRPAYLPRRTMSASQAIALLRQRNAVPVLAHPGLIKWPLEKLLPMLRMWQEAGLRGIEVYHHANKGSFAYWDEYARKHGLLVTGGSDYHDGTSSHGQIGEIADLWPRAMEDGWALYRAATR